MLGSTAAKLSAMVAMFGNMHLPGPYTQAASGYPTAESHTWGRRGAGISMASQKRAAVKAKNRARNKRNSHN